MNSEKMDQIPDRKDCPCPKRRCPRHLHCKECYTYHKNRGNMLPFCLRKKTFLTMLYKIFVR